VTKQHLHVAPVLTTILTATAWHQVKVHCEQPKGSIFLTGKTPRLQARAGRIANVDAAFDTSAKHMRRR
jgi:hypothetical protein